MLPGKVEHVLLTSEQIIERVDELGRQIRKDHPNAELTCICLLKGSSMFFCDLMRAIGSPMRMEFMRAASYGNSTTSSGSVKILTDLDADIEGHEVVIVEDIVDTGRTLDKVIDLLKGRNPKSLQVVSLLNKPSRRVVEVPIDYVGFEIDDHFVVGYGLDYDDYYRELPYVGILNLEG